MLLRHLSHSLKRGAIDSARPPLKDEDVPLARAPAIVQQEVQRDALARELAELQGRSRCWRRAQAQKKVAAPAADVSHREED